MGEIKLITVCDNPQRATRLIKSAEKHGWDLVVIQSEWKGFGTKLIETYNYLKEHPEVTEFVFADAYDVVVFGMPEEFKQNLGISKEFIVCSAEKGCWPVDGLRNNYLYKHKGGFNFLNSGLYYTQRDMFLQLIEEGAPDYESDDQLYLTEQYLFNNYGRIVLDQSQVIFNSHSFIAEGEYTYENGRVQIMGNEPIFIHSNGKTADPKLEEMLTKIGL